ncbi:MAG: HEPN domain-containing protein [Thermodesulfobacteriota bacterium]|nr:HEPN domain-containing protein [Thermodesulfobacteriota bacterium]
MRDETKTWLKYANENFQSAKVLLDSSLFNPCLQNIQQFIEKLLKALLIEFSMKFERTHSINELKNSLAAGGINIDMSKEESDLLDSIYLPSKYPLGSVLPDFEPDMEICIKCMSIAERTKVSIEKYFS